MPPKKRLYKLGPNLKAKRIATLKKAKLNYWAAQKALLAKPTSYTISRYIRAKEALHKLGYKYS
jgi:hypothetical protein